MIPKQIFTCWIGDEPPANIRGLIDEAKRINEASGWSYTVWGKNALDRYADDPYIKSLLAKGEKLAFIVDRIRLLLARDDGGFWVDSDAKFIRSMSLLNAVCARPDVDFITGLRNPWRPNLGIGRGIPIVDNTVFGSAKNGNMVKRILALYKPEHPKQTGHTMGMEVLRTADQNTVLLNYRYYYAMNDQVSPETILLHDQLNMHSWKDELPKI